MVNSMPPLGLAHLLTMVKVSCFPAWVMDGPFSLMKMAHSDPFGLSALSFFDNHIMV